MPTFIGYSNFKINGVQLQTHGWNVISTSGIDGIPARRGTNVPTPYQDGDYSFGEKFYDSRIINLQMGVMPQDSDGLVTAADGPQYHLRANLDYLKGVFQQNSGLQVFSFDVKDGIGGFVTREIDVEILTASRFQDFLKFGKSFTVIMDAPRPFWRELPLVTVSELNKSTFPYNFNIDTLGNAPIGDLKITLDALAAGSTPSLECVVTGDKITIGDGAVALNDQYIIDLGLKSFTKNGAKADSLITRASAEFMRLPPAAALAMILDATSGTYDLKLEYYKKWL